MSKPSFTTKSAIALGLMLCAVFSNAQSRAVPISIHYGGGEGVKDILSLWLAINLFLITYFLIRAIIYPMIKNKVKWTNKWYQFIITDSSSCGLGLSMGIATCAFVVINGMAILFLTADWISTLLK